MLETPCWSSPLRSAGLAGGAGGSLSCRWELTLSTPMWLGRWGGPGRGSSGLPQVDMAAPPVQFPAAFKERPLK